jgi:hypothetical protein
MQVYNIHDFTEGVVCAFIGQRINSNTEMLNIGVEMFGDYVDIFSVVATLLNMENQLPDVHQRILKWINS